MTAKIPWDDHSIISKACERKNCVISVNWTLIQRNSESKRKKYDKKRNVYGL